MDLINNGVGFEYYHLTPIEFWYTKFLTLFRRNNVFVVISLKLIWDNTENCQLNTLWWAQWRLISLASRFFASLFVQAQHIEKKTSKLRVTVLCGGNPPVTCGLPPQSASNAENVFIWWRHDVAKWKNHHHETVVVGLLESDQDCIRCCYWIQI